MPNKDNKACRSRDRLFLFNKKMKTMRKINVKSKKMLADTFTPVSIYLKIRDVFSKSILLESTDFHHLENCYSFICISPIADFIIEEKQIIKRVKDNITKEIIGDHINVTNELQSFTSSFNCQNNELPFNGFYGYSSYDAVQYFESIQLNKKENDLAIPVMQYSLFKYIIAFNHFNDEIIMIENILDDDLSQLDSLEDIIRSGKTSEYPFKVLGDEQANMSDLDYIQLVQKAKKHCLRGDVFQLVLSRRFSQKFQGDDFSVYRQLRSLNPSPYLFYFDYGSFRVFGSSPESQLEIKNNKAFINPIAGTYARSGNDEKDKELAITLSEDVKENAEHVMLVDLARNDLSRSTSNIKLENFKDIHFYSHVIHIVSKVSGVFKDKKQSIKILADTFPAGTLTGAPKYKAMQLIDEYEPVSRKFYGGCIGFIGFNGNINKAITIRSFLSKDNALYYQAGAGIVSKSDENRELQEVNHKLGALKQAISNACQNRDSSSELKNQYSIINRN